MQSNLNVKSNEAERSSVNAPSLMTEEYKKLHVHVTS